MRANQEVAIPLTSRSSSTAKFLTRTAAPAIAVSAGVRAFDAAQYSATMKNVLPMVFLTSQISGGLREGKVGSAPAALLEGAAADGTPRSSIVWINEGRLYSLGVRGSMNFALTVANSLD
ncbi:MAG TPA: hypothetical protein VGN17_05610 [Bryobacteraceae bacterium]